MQVIEDRDAAVQQLTDVMWKFTSYIGKRLPTDVTHKLADLRAKETHPLAKAVYQSMKENQDAADKLDRPSCQDTGVIQYWGDRPFRAVWCALLEKHVEGQSLRRRAPSADFILSVQIGTLCSTECCPSRCRRFSPYVQVSAFAETPQRLKSAPSPRLRCCERRPVIAGNFRGRPGRTR